MGYIYLITNTVNGKIYVGQTKRNIESRWKEHRRISPAKIAKFGATPLFRAIKKYGVDAFTIEQLEECDNALLDEREIYWIDKLNARTIGYNIAKGGTQSRDCEPVVQFSLEGKFIRTFNSIYEASSETGLKIGGIYCACDGWNVQHTGYQWRYLKDAEKLGMTLPPCKPPNKSTQVHQYTLDGDYIASFPSISEASKSFGEHGGGGVRLACMGKMLESHGYRWSFEKVDKLPEMGKNKTLRPVAKLDDNGKIIEIYDSMTDAAIKNNVSLCAISAVCKGRNKTSAGYGWKYYSA